MKLGVCITAAAISLADFDNGSGVNRDVLASDDSGLSKILLNVCVCSPRLTSSWLCVAIKWESFLTLDEGTVAATSGFKRWTFIPDV